MINYKNGIFINKKFITRHKFVEDNKNINNNHFKKQFKSVFDLSLKHFNIINISIN